MGDSRAEVLLRQAAVEPSEGMQLAAVNAALDFLSDVLSADDYATAVGLLLAAIDPDAAAT
jgi:hypothetical protein